MKMRFWMILAMVLACTMLKAQSVDMAAEKAAIRAAVMDYMEGAHEGDASREERCLHYELNKVSLRPMRETNRTFLQKAGYTRLVELVRANVAPLPEEDRKNIEVDIFVVKEGLACAKAVSKMFYDYCQLAKIDGQWKLLNVLWRWNPTYQRQGSPPEPAPETDIEVEKTAIRKTALDYIEGAYSGDAERMERALHPELNKVMPAVLPQTGKTMISKSGYALLIEGTAAELMIVEEDKRDIQVNIFDVQRDIAMVEVLSLMYFDYLQIGKVNGEWKIINVLWKPNPEAPRPQRR